MDELERGRVENGSVLIENKKKKVDERLCLLKACSHLCIYNVFIFLYGGKMAK